MFLWIVESPDTTNIITIIVNEPRVTYSPNCNNRTVLANDLVSVSFWWIMFELNFFQGRHGVGLGSFHRDQLTIVDFLLSSPYSFFDTVHQPMSILQLITLQYDTFCCQICRKSVDNSRLIFIHQSKLLSFSILGMIRSSYPG